MFVVFSLLRTSFTDPGILPRATADEAADVEKQIGEWNPGGLLLWDRWAEGAFFFFLPGWLCVCGGVSSGVLGSELSSLPSVHSRCDILTIVVFFMSALPLATMCLVTIGLRNTHQYRAREVVQGRLKG